MKKDKSEILTLLGKVEKRLIKKLLNHTVSEKENILWVFVDYSISEVELNTHFDVLLETETTSIIPGKFSVKLLKVLDQFGNNLDSIPKGFQTICRLQFTPELPRQIRNLPSLAGWVYNPSSISIGKHENIRFYSDDLVLKTIYKFASMGIRQVFISYSGANVKLTKSIFIEFLSSHYETDKYSAEVILKELMLLGHVKANKNKELELVTDDQFG